MARSRRGRAPSWRRRLRSAAGRLPARSRVRTSSVAGPLVRGATSVRHGPYNLVQWGPNHVAFLATRVRYSRPMDLPSFLRSYPPFDELDDERLAEVVRHT